MERKYKITIPEPCHENWNKMTPSENGRFCMSCSKTVVDFTSMLPNEIQHFFIQNQNNSVCGRFRKSQLDTIIIQIPERILYSQTHYHKMFLLALFIVMGTTLFSCADNEGNKVKIEVVEVVEDNSKNIIDRHIHDSLIEKPKPEPVKISPNIILLEPSVSGSSNHIESYISGGISGYPVCYIDTLPDYPGGYGKFKEFIKNEFQIPKKARRIAGEIEVSFVIEKTGTLNQIKVFDNIGHDTGEEMIRVLQNSKKWMPGIVNGKAIPAPFRLKIVVQKDSLNIERTKRKLTKIVSIDFVSQDKYASSKKGPEDNLKQNITLTSNEAEFKNTSKISCEESMLQNSVVEDDIIVMGAAIETKANFPNGINAFYEFFAQEFKMPELAQNLKDRIIVSFVINKDGSLTSFQFPKNTEPQLEAEITRVLALSPKWIPGTQNGKKTREKYRLPIAIQEWKANTK